MRDLGARFGLIAVLSGISLALATGCDRFLTAEQARDRQIKEHAQYQLPSAVAKFAGRVTVDGKPPKPNCRLIVILYDPLHLNETADGGAPKLFARCDKNGEFGFSTYGRHDGVVAGKYIVTFVELHRPLGSGRRGIRTSPFLLSPELYWKPDELHNLYNDPDVNAKIDEFNLNLQPMGPSHFQFNLVVAGKKAVEKPGPNALVGVAER